MAAADTHMLTCQSQPSSSLKTSAIRYRLMPDMSSVITANEIALSMRMRSSKRSFRYPGTEWILLE